MFFSIPPFPQASRHFQHSRGHPRSLAVLTLVIALTLGLAACGASSSSSGGAGSASAGATATSTPPRSIGGTTVRPCVGPYASVTSGGTPNVVLDEQTPNGTASAHVGDLVQVRLHLSMSWRLTSSGAGLSLVQPGATQDTQLNVCFWNFRAASAGSATLVFTGHALCDPNTPCSMIVRNQTFTVNIA